MTKAVYLVLLNGACARAGVEARAAARPSAPASATQSTKASRRADDTLIRPSDTEPIRGRPRPTTPRGTLTCEVPPFSRVNRLRSNFGARRAVAGRARRDVRS